MKKHLTTLLFFLFAGISVFGQDAKFGGPFTAFSFNQHGPSMSIGGGGTFIVKNNYYIGIFGQGTSDAFTRPGDNGYEDYLLKSRQTGFWLGYNHRFSNTPKLSTSIYSKVGFGQVQLNDPVKSVNYYDGTTVITPNIEFAYTLTSFFEIGIAFYYEMFTGVDLLHYSAKDFNSYGASILLKFKKM